MRRFLSVVAVICLAGGFVVSIAEAQQLENIEWCNIRWDYTHDTKLPRVLLIGDSISVGYGGIVKEELKGIANVDTLATSKAIDNPGLLKETAYVIEGFKHAVIHFNNGLHGGHVTDAQYEAHLRAYVDKLKQLAPEAKLIWASSTPVPSSKEGVKLDEKRNGVVLARNAIAAKIMKEKGIPINDLYSLMVGDLENLSANKGNVHYGAKGREIQGKAVAAAIKKALQP